MKLTENQAFKVMDLITKTFNLKLEPSEVADFVMLELINKELGEE